MTPNTSPLHISEKSLSFVTTIRSSAMEIFASVLSVFDFFAFLKLISLPVRNSASSMRTFSSSKNWMGVDDDIIVPSERARILQGGSDLFSRERSDKSVLNIFNAFAGCEHFQNLPHHNARAIKGWLAVTNFRVGDNIFVDDNAPAHMLGIVSQSMARARTPVRWIRLFEGFRIKLISGRLIIQQR